MTLVRMSDEEAGAEGQAWKQAGDTVRERRKIRNWTQEELADAAHLSSRTVGKLERGDRISMTNLRDIGRALDVAEDLELMVRGWRRMPMTRSVVMPFEEAQRLADRGLVAVPAVTDPSGDDEDNPVLAAIRSDPDLDDAGRTHFQAQYLLLRDLARLRRGAAAVDEPLAYAAHRRQGVLPVEKDPAHEAEIERAARAAAEANPHSPMHKPKKPKKP